MASALNKRILCLRLIQCPMSVQKLCEYWHEKIKCSRDSTADLQKTQGSATKLNLLSRSIDTGYCHEWCEGEHPDAELQKKTWFIYKKEEQKAQLSQINRNLQLWNK